MDIKQAIDKGVNRLAQFELENTEKKDWEVNFQLWMITFEPKPTTHKQKCPACTVYLNKGDKTVKVCCGAYHTSPCFSRYHVDCFMALLCRKLLKAPEVE